MTVSPIPIAEERLRWTAQIPMSSGQWAYSLGEAGELPRGVYRRDDRWSLVGPLPYVREVITVRAGDGKVHARLFRLSPEPGPVSSAPVTLVNSDDIGKGSWGGKIGLSVSCEPRIAQAVGTAIRQVAYSGDVPMVESVPDWRAGTLSVPAADVGPAGYGLVAPIPEAEARQAWSELLADATAAPKAGLVLGAALGGLFVSPLNRQPWVLMLVGQGGKGKTTALALGAAVYGPPTKAAGTASWVVREWNTTPLGVMQSMGALKCVPAFWDEYGAGKISPEQTERLILSLAQGSSRTRCDRDGVPSSSARWDSVMVMSGNDSLLADVTNEGVFRRLIEVEAPITHRAEDSERIKALISRCYGWPLHWLRQAGITPEQFAVLVAAAEAEIGLSEEAVPRSLAQHLALSVAGAELLAELVGGDPEPGRAFRSAVLEVARELVDQMTREAAERGATPAERVLAAVTDRMAARPASYPTRNTYRAALAGEGVGPYAPPVPREVEGWDIRQDTTLDGDVAVLSGLLRNICAEAGITNPGAGLRELAREADAGRAGLVCSGSEGRRVQRLNVGGPGRPSVYLFRLADPDSIPDQAGGDPVQDGHRPSDGHGHPSGHSVAPERPVTPTTAATAGPVATATDQPGHGHDSGQESGHQVATTAATATCERCADPAGIWCGFGEVATDRAPCLVCGEPTPTRSACGAVRHGGCRTPATHVDAEPGGELAAPEPRKRVLRPVPDPVPAEELVDPEAELGHFSKAVRERYPAATDADLTAGLAAFVAATDGLRFVAHPGAVGIAAYARLVARHPAMVVPVEIDESALDGVRPRLSIDYLTPKMAIPEDGCHLTGLDINAQYLAAARSVELGDGDPVVGSRNPNRVITSNCPGYVRISRAVQTKRAGLGDGTGKLARGEWITTPMAKYLMGRGVELPIDEVIYWPKHGRRLDKWAAQFNAAYRALKQTEGVPGVYALAAVKAVYTTFLGGMLASGRYNHTALRRPDWRDQVRTLAYANQLRALDKAEAAGHRPLGVYRDATWWLHETPEPFFPDGLTIDPVAPGKWKHEFTTEFTDTLRDAYEGGSPQKFREALGGES